MSLFKHEFEDLESPCKHCGLSRYCEDTECSVRLREVLDRLEKEELWPKSFSELERAAMYFAWAWVRKAPYAAGLGAISRLERAARSLPVEK